VISAVMAPSPSSTSPLGPAVNGPTVMFGPDCGAGTAIGVPARTGMSVTSSGSATALTVAGVALVVTMSILVTRASALAPSSGAASRIQSDTSRLPCTSVIQNCWPGPRAVATAPVAEARNVCGPRNGTSQVSGIRPVPICAPPAWWACRAVVRPGPGPRWHTTPRP
jgi:hypothetical protein